MKHTLLTAFIFIITSTSIYGQDGPKTYPLDEVIVIINESINEANFRLGSNSAFNVESATISLKTVSDISGGGGFKLFVKASKEWQLQKASTITYNFIKDKAYAKNKSLESFEEKFKESLIQAIVSGSTQYLNASNVIPGLKKDSFTVQVSFSATESNGAGIDFEIFGLGVDAGADKSLNATHTITIKFSKR